MSQSRPIFSCIHADRFSKCFPDERTFSIVLRHLTTDACKRFRMVLCDISIPFCFSFSWVSYKVIWGFFESTSTITLSSHCGAFRKITHFLINNFDFFVYVTVPDGVFLVLLICAEKNCFKELWRETKYTSKEIISFLNPNFFKVIFYATPL